MQHLKDRKEVDLPGKRFWEGEKREGDRSLIGARRLGSARNNVSARQPGDRWA